MAFTPIPKSGNCFDVGRVCENHPYCPWDRTKPRGCECGARMPCPVCNPAGADWPPLPPAGFKSAVELFRRGKPWRQERLRSSVASLQRPLLACSGWS